jgi:hypothetical protein
MMAAVSGVQVNFGHPSTPAKIRDRSRCIEDPVLDLTVAHCCIRIAEYWLEERKRRRPNDRRDMHEPLRFSQPIEYPSTT